MSAGSSRIRLRKLWQCTYSVNPSKLDPGSSNFRQLGYCLSDFRRVHRICTWQFSCAFKFRAFASSSFSTRQATCEAPHGASRISSWWERTHSPGTRTGCRLTPCLRSHGQAVSNPERGPPKTRTGFELLHNSTNGGPCQGGRIHTDSASTAGNAECQGASALSNPSPSRTLVKSASRSRRDRSEKAGRLPDVSGVQSADRFGQERRPIIVATAQPVRVSPGQTGHRLTAHVQPHVREDKRFKRDSKHTSKA